MMFCWATWTRDGGQFFNMDWKVLEAESNAPSLSPQTGQNKSRSKGGESGA